MALTEFQRAACRLVADNRIASGESYVAGGAALNELIPGTRISRDIDVIHDTDEAVAASWDRDRRVFEGQGFEIRVLRERPSYVEAEVRAAGQSLRMEWARDSAYRFFPLVRHDEFGLALHPFDLATNKVLALVGRLLSTSCSAPNTCSRSGIWRGRRVVRIRDSARLRFSSRRRDRAVIQ